MGAAQSSNTSDSISKIANSISSNTSTTQSQVDHISNTVSLNNCNIGGDVNIKAVNQSIAKSRQIVDAFQQTNIQNMIAQQMQQKAQSTVGALGLGYSDANNYVSTYASTTNDVVNMVYTFNNQASFFDATVKCNGTIVGGDFNINISTMNKFWNEQGVSSQQLTDISNKIDQKISQTAKSKVAGLGGFLIGIIAIIGAIIYAVVAPVGEALSSLKVALAIFILFGIILLFIWLWLIEWSPFFSELKTCVLSGTLLKGQCTPQKCKVNNNNPQTINIEHPPLRYIHGLIARGAPRSESAYGMMNMMIFGGQIVPNVSDFNQGFNAAQYWTFADEDNPNKWKGDTSYKSYGVDQIPNPLYVPTGTHKDDDSGEEYPVVYIIPEQYNTKNPDTPTAEGDAGSMTPSVYVFSKDPIIMKKDKYDKAVQEKDYGTLLRVVAILNDGAWDTYLHTGDKDTQRKKMLHMRFVLALNLGIDTNVYIYDDEEVTVGEEILLAKDAKDKVYQYANFASPPFNDLSYGIKGSGTLTGIIGICDSRANKVNKFFIHIGNYIMLAILVIVLGVLVYFCVRTK